jgi:hypothetical protein
LESIFNRPFPVAHRDIFPQPKSPLMCTPK